MPRIVDPVLPVLSILGYEATILGTLMACFFGSFKEASKSVQARLKHVEAAMDSGPRSPQRPRDSPRLTRRRSRGGDGAFISDRQLAPGCHEGVAKGRPTVPLKGSGIDIRQVWSGSLKELCGCC